MDEQWLCNVSVWDGREMCDLSAAAASTLSSVSTYNRFALPGTPFDRLSLSWDTGSRKRNTSGNDYDSSEK